MKPPDKYFSDPGSPKIEKLIIKKRSKKHFGIEMRMFWVKIGVGCGGIFEDITYENEKSSSPLRDAVGSQI